MKKTVIILIGIIICTLSIGNLVIHKCYLKLYKKELKSYIKLNKENISTSQIVINPSELFVNGNEITWEDENKEIIYQGCLYDILSIKNEKGKVILTVLSDKQEQEIKNQFADIYNASSSDSNNKPMQLLKQFLALKFTSSESLFVGTPLIGLSKHQTIYQLIKTTSFQREDIHPPDTILQLS